MEPNTIITPSPQGAKVAIAIVIALLIIGGVYFFSKLGSRTIAPEAVTWDLTPVTGATTSVQTKVTVHVEGEAFEAGTYPGECAHIGETQLLGNEVSGIVCLIPGGGDEIGVFRDADGHYTIRRGEIRTPSEATRGEGYRGRFTTLFAL